jgi:hypothetical protein
LRDFKENDMSRRRRNQATPRNTPSTRVEDLPSKEADLPSLLSDLAEFEEFRTKILPAIRTDLMKGLSAAELRKKYAALVQARILTEAITAPDAGKITALAKDVIDRVEGKPTEKKEVTVKYADLSDEELDAMLLSEEAEFEHIIQERGDGH